MPTRQMSVDSRLSLRESSATFAERKATITAGSTPASIPSSKLPPNVTEIPGSKKIVDSQAVPSNSICSVPPLSSPRRRRSPCGNFMPSAAGASSAENAVPSTVPSRPRRSSVGHQSHDFPKSCPESSLTAWMFRHHPCNRATVLRCAAPVLGGAETRKAQLTIHLRRRAASQVDHHL